MPDRAQESLMDREACGGARRGEVDLPRRVTVLEEILRRHKLALSVESLMVTAPLRGGVHDPDAE
jgi:hypothetical protein